MKPIIVEMPPITEADSLADLRGYPRPDNPSPEALAAWEAERAVPRFCTCDGAGRGPGRSCVVKGGGRLGDAWTCREQWEAARAAVAALPAAPAELQSLPQRIVARLASLAAVVDDKERDEYAIGYDRACQACIREVLAECAAPTEPHPGAWDERALLAARRIADLSHANHTQWVAGVQCEVLDAMRWAAPAPAAPTPSHHEAAARLRAWAGMGGAGYSRQVCADLCAWIEAGAQGPLPAMPRECAAPAARVHARDCRYTGGNCVRPGCVQTCDALRLVAVASVLPDTAPAAPAVPVPLPISTADPYALALLYAPPENLFSNPAGKLGQWMVAAPKNWTWASHWMPLPDAPAGITLQPGGEG